jgi:hypothetical protein
MSRKCDIKVCQEHATIKGGKLISTEYINSYTKMSWECEKGHQWSACWNSIKSQDNWCLLCSGKAKPDIIELQEYAKNKEGKLISTEYINCFTKMLWECKEGHQWKAHWHSIKNSNSNVIWIK